jgi:hypothetical protein
MLSLRLVSIGIVCLGTAATGVALAAEGDGTVPTKASVVAPPTTAVLSVDPGAAAAFKLLRTTPPSQMPADVAAMVASPDRFGRNAALARAIETPTGTGWVIPGAGFLCIAVPDPVDGWGTSCVPTKVGVRRGLAIGLTAADGRSTETLLVPDGATAEKVVGPVSTGAPAATVASVRKRVRVSALGVATARTNAPGSLRVRR